MALIRLGVEIDDLENGQLDGIKNKFEIWLWNAYKSLDAPDGHIAMVDEIEREEDDEEETNDGE